MKRTTICRVFIGLLVVVVAIAGQGPNAAAAVFPVLSDNFDSAAVGSFPLQPVGIMPANGNFYVTNGIAGTPSAPNVLEMGNLHNGPYQAGYFFNNLTLTNGSLIMSYDINVAAIPNGSLDGNAGFTISIGRGSAGGGFPSGNIGGLRVFSDAGTTTSWRIFDNTLGVMTNGLAINTFYTITTEITPNTLNPTTGLVTWSLDGNQIGSLAYNNAVATNLNGVKFDAVQGTAADEAIVYFLDNLNLTYSIPEPTVGLLLGFGGLILWRRRAQREA